MINLSVVIPVYNGETDLPDLIECLRSQTYPADRVEYLLVDNNSRDNSVSIVQELAASSSINIRSLSENNIQSSYAAAMPELKSQPVILLPLPIWIADRNPNG